MPRGRQRSQQVPHDEPHILLQKQFDELEKSIGLSLIQINTQLEVLSPITQTVTELEANMDQLRKELLGLKTSLEPGFSAKPEPALNDLKAKVAQLQDTMLEVSALNDFKAKVSQLENSMSELLDDVKSKFVRQGEEMMALTRQECRASELQVSVQDDHISNTKNHALQTGFEGTRDAAQANQKALVEIQKQLDVHRAEIDQIQDMGLKVSRQICNIEKISQEHQKKLSRPHSDIASLLRDTSSIVQRQEKICDELVTMEKKMMELSKESSELRIVKANVQDQAMEIDEICDDTETTELIDIIVTKRCTEAAEIQNRHLAAELESFKDCVLLTQKKALEPILEKTDQNSEELIKIREELQSLHDSRSQFERACQEQNNLGDKLAIMEGKILDLPNKNNYGLQLRSVMQNQSTHVAILGTSEHEKLMQLVAKKCDESFDAQQHTFAELITAQKQEFQLIIEQAQKNSSELTKQAGELTCIRNFEALLEHKITSIQGVNNKNTANLEKANSFINLLVQKNELISKRQSTLEGEVSELSRSVNEAAKQQPMDVDVLAADRTEKETLLEQVAKKCQESLRSQQHSFELFKQLVLSAQNKNLEPIFEQAKRFTSELSKQKRDLDFIRKYYVENKSRIHPIQICNAGEDLLSINQFDFVGEGQSQDEAQEEEDRGRTSEEHINEEGDSDHQINESHSKILQQGTNVNLNARNAIEIESDESSSSNPSDNPSNLRQSHTTNPFASHKSQSPKRKYLRPNRMPKNKIPRESLRKERLSMEPCEKDDDICLSNAIQDHIRILTGLPRAKGLFPPSPTAEELDNLPELPSNSSALSTSASFLIPAKAVRATWDTDNEMGEGFSTYCLRRARQYGLPFVGLSIFLEDPKALEWNRRTAAFCTDTFHQAVTAHDNIGFFRAGYDFDSVDPARVETLIRKNLEYRIAEMTKDFKRAKGKVSEPNHSGNFNHVSEDGKLKAKKLRQADEQQDRRTARRVALARRRYQTIQSIPEMVKYSRLFEDECLCSSDESSEDLNNETRIRHAPVWRSKQATALCEKVDLMAEKMRNERPRGPGRKPAKRISLGAQAPSGGALALPRSLPVDCYDEYWLTSKSAEVRAGLKVDQPIFD